MKKCNYCGTMVADDALFCGTCGASFTATSNAQPMAQAYPSNYNVAVQNQIEQQSKDNGNVLAGIVGAFLFSIIGAAVYFGFYQLGIIAGICSLVIFFLANLGYDKFSKTKNKNSKIGIIVSVIVTAVMIFVAEYFCVAFEIFNVYKDQGVTFLDAFFATPEFMADPDVGAAVAEDLVFAYIIGAIILVVNLVKAKKKKK